jgi:ABC-type Fe3+-hydroxamate transport system substrate-binding protein
MGAPARIVSLVPSTTESVCALGAGAALVGCTRYCTEPAGALRAVTRVGGTKNPSRDAVMRLLPDLLLANAEENRAEDLEWFARRMPVFVQTPRTVATAAADLAALAARLGRPGAAAPWLTAIDAALAHAAAAAGRARGLRVYYAIWRRPWMSVNADTFAGDVLRLAGTQNVCAADAPRYPEVTPATAIERGVQVVLLASEPWAFDEAQRGEIERDGTFGGARVLCCDGRDFCWHGVHMAQGLDRAFTGLAALATGPQPGGRGSRRRDA